MLNPEHILGRMAWRDVRERINVSGVAFMDQETPY